MEGIGRIGKANTSVHLHTQSKELLQPSKLVLQLQRPKWAPLQIPRPIESERRNMEKLLTRTLDQGRPLMWQVHEPLEVESCSMIVGQRGKVGELGLTNDEPGARLVKEHEVHDAAPPDYHPVLTTEALIADKGVASTVVVVCIIVGSEVVLLGSVLALD